MDDFGVLVSNYGIKPQGKSAPMAASKMDSRTQNHNFSNPGQSVYTNGFSKSIHSSESVVGSYLDQNDLFGLSSGHKPQTYANGDANVFDGLSFSNGGGAIGDGGFDFNVDLLMGSGSSSGVNLKAKGSDVSDDLIWGFSGQKSTNVMVESNDLLSSDPVDDFWGKLGKLGFNSGENVAENKGNTANSEDLIPGFWGTNGATDRAQDSSTSKSADFSLEDFEGFAMAKTKKNANGNLDAITVKNDLNKGSKHKSRDINFFDVEGISDGDSFFKKEVEMGREEVFQTEPTDLDSFFGAHMQKRVPVSEDKPKGYKVEEVPDFIFGATGSKQKKAPPTKFPDDFSSIFGGSPSSSKFEEVEGESEERRRARLGRFQRTEAQVAQALAQMKQREYEAQLEQEERDRIAEAMDVEMKQWARGKEGNLRALLSSLQEVLGPEFGWRPVTLTDLITSGQVKLVYKKAALCVHPDKVQQRGASLQQKLVAEKVFDLLKEACNKFSKEELR